jgi:uncharacterized RDD family membrane protein YckC
LLARLLARPDASHVTCLSRRPLAQSSPKPELLLHDDLALLAERLSRQAALTRQAAPFLMPPMDPSFSNPYQAPAAGEPLETESVAPGQSATRGSRLVAYLMDSIIGFAVMFPLQLWAGVFKGFPSEMKPQQFPKSLVWSLGWIVLWIALNGTFLAKSAQTIGKKLMGLQIVMVKDGKPASFERLVFWRFVPVMLVSQIPYAGAVLSLVDSLFIFRADRRCLHDHIAGTRVVALEKK